MALGPVCASIWPILTMSWARAGAKPSATTVNMRSRHRTIVICDLLSYSPSERQPPGDDLAHHLRRAGGDRPQPHVGGDARDHRQAVAALTGCMKGDRR